MSYRNRTSELRRRGNIGGYSPRERKETVRSKTSRPFPIAAVVELEGEEFLVASARMTNKGVIYDIVNEDSFEVDVRHKDIELLEKDSAKSVKKVKELLKEKY